MNRTTQAAIIFALALVTLGVAIWGRVLGKGAEAAIRERQGLEQRIDQVQTLRTQRLALAHRMKKIYGRQAQLQAVQAPADEIAKFTEEIILSEKRLAELDAALAKAESAAKAPALPAP